MLKHLRDDEFLKKLDREQHREVYVRIAALTWEEFPIEYIEGKATGGSISIDGTSSVRRTCSLQLIAEGVSLNDCYWGLNTKFSLEIGLKNTIKPEYGDVVWFPQGIYILTGFNTTLSSKAWNISISGKDKMCMLNGDLGGNLGTTIDFGAEQYYDLETGITTINKFPVMEIIKNAVCSFGNELASNIIISDVDKYGYELIDYNGDKPLFLLKKFDQGIYTNITFKGDLTCYEVTGYLVGNGVITKITNANPKGILLNSLPSYDTGTHVSDTDDERGTLITFTQPKSDGTFDSNNVIGYWVRKVQQGDTVGYRLTNLVYPEDLISKPGDTVTSILDKIVKMLGNFEYFYDEFGRFVFQEKNNNIYNNWTPITALHGGLYMDPVANPLAYSFTNMENVTQITHNPQLAKIKNDFSIWGTTKSASGMEVDVHLRQALEKKPLQYTSIGMSKTQAEEYSLNAGFTVKSQESVTYTDDEWDWREIIYRMAKDYMQYGQLDDFSYLVRIHNTSSPDADRQYPSGSTGYEHFYVDMYSKWREVYNPDFLLWEDDKQPNKSLVYYTKNTQGYEQHRWKDVFELKTFAEAGVLLFDINGDQYTADDSSATIPDEALYYYKKDGEPLTEYTEKYKLKNKLTYYRQNDYETDSEAKDNFGTFFYKDNNYWIKDKINNPAKIRFWFDLLGEGTNLEKYFISAIGNRSKVINDKDVSAIYFTEIPDILFVKSKDYIDMVSIPEEFPPQYTIIILTEQMQNLFSISTQGKAAQRVYEEALYDHTYLNDSVNITTVPIYHLPVNTRIEVNNIEPSLDGEYIISKITVPLTYNGTMQLTASRIETIIY